MPSAPPSRARPTSARTRGIRSSSLADSTVDRVFIPAGWLEVDRLLLRVLDEGSPDISIALPERTGAAAIVNDQEIDLDAAELGQTALDTAHELRRNAPAPVGCRGCN